MKYPKRTKAYREALEEYGDPFRVAFENFQDIEEAIEAVKDNYQGCFRSLEAYAMDWMDQTGGLSGLPENLRAYFDFAAFGRDMESGDIWTAESEEGGIHVFLN